jgi:hypothetical protein
LGRIVLQQGDAERTRALGEESVLLLQKLGGMVLLSSSLALLGRVASAQGNHAEARTFYEQSIQVASERGFKWEFALGLEGLASVVAAQGEPTWAARLWGAAEALRETLGAPLPPVYRADYEREVATARAQLGEQLFDIAWSQGRSMPYAQVLSASGRVELPQ